MSKFLTFFADHRIFVSRIFAVLFFLVLAFCESKARHPLWQTLIFLVGLVLIGIAIVGRLWCSLYISGYKNSQLICQGPYSMTRNPLYFFSWLGFIGLGFTTYMWSFALMIAIAFLLVYPAVIYYEERFLADKFTNEFKQYCEKVPKFFPKISLFTEPEVYQVNPKLFRRTMGDVVWFIWFVGFIQIIHSLKASGAWQTIFLMP